MLKDNTKFVWGKVEEEAFKTSKDALMSSKVLAHFNPNLQTFITCDGSPVGVGAILSQVDSNNVEKPVCYASKTLSKAEQNYSQTDREGLSVIFALKKWHKCLVCRRFKINDHKPLLGLLGKGIPEHASARVQRWAIMLSAYDCEITHISGSSNVADFLSRSPLQNMEEIDSTPQELHELFQFLDISAMAKVDNVKKETALDTVLSKVYTKVKYGWSEQDKNDKDLKPYFIRKNELSIEKDCLMWGVRVIIPPNLRKIIMTLLHDTHIGAARMKAQARSWVWWPNMDAEIEFAVKTCHLCQTHSNKSVKVPLFQWDWPEEPWHRVHLDFAGPYLGRMFLIITDAHSKWLEIKS